MLHHTFGARATVRHLTGFDSGLRVRVETHVVQHTVFSSPQDLPVQALTSELARLVSGLRVYSYAVRGQLERLTSVLQLNVQCGSWSYARRAALDLSCLLAQEAKGELVHRSRLVRAANHALRIAELCAKEAR